MKTAVELSMSVAKMAVVDKMNDLYDLQNEQMMELEGIREAFINYSNVCEEIIKNLEATQDAK